MLILFLCLFYASSGVIANTHNASEIITNIPDDYKKLYHYYFREEELPTWGIVAGTTLFTYYYDRQIYNSIRRKALRVEGEGQVDDRQKIMFNILGLPVRTPENTNTHLYFIGDGITLISVNLGFYLYGYLGHSEQAKTTAYQLTEGLLAITLTTQVLKRTFGREDPYDATKTRGRWKLFPGFDQYNNATSSYDSFPSGHVAALTTTLTIINENYPEYRSWLFPLSAAFVTILGTAMIANGEHWASDYPLAIMLGYGLGRVIGSRQKDKEQEEKLLTSRWQWQLVSNRQGNLGLGLVTHF